MFPEHIIADIWRPNSLWSVSADNMGAHIILTVTFCKCEAGDRADVSHDRCQHTSPSCVYSQVESEPVCMSSL